MFNIVDVANINGTIWFLVQKDSYWTIQRNGGFPRHMGRGDYVNRVWRKNFLKVKNNA